MRIDGNPPLCYHEKQKEGAVMEIRTLKHEEVLKLLPDRPRAAHKGFFGKILLLCGSVGYTGAAALAAMGALRCGAGLVYLGVPRSIYAIEAVKLTEPIVFPLPEADGMLCADALEQILPRLSGMDAVLVGCGLGQSGGTRAVLEGVLRHADCPVILDADGINLLQGHMDIVRQRHAATVLTPHEGEFARLTGGPCKDRIGDAVKFARDTGTVLVLKGQGTVITDGNICCRNETGNPGMAVGGSGDVLAGMITALCGQKLPPVEAAACGAWLHGAAGDLCREEIGEYGMLPSDLLCVLGRLMK